MTTWEILLLIAGFACVCLSFFVARGKEGAQAEDKETQGSSDVWTEKEEELIRERVTQLMEERQNELLDETQDQMSHLCNDKIMAIDEFSQPLMEKIRNNHQEVVFMYNMLTEKEKEVKRILAQSVVKEVKSEKPKPAEQGEKKTVQKPAVAAVAAKPTPKPASKPAPEPEPTPKKVAAKPPEEPVVKPPEQEPVSVKNVPGNVNLKIQKMYREGKSILEISKELGIGQGEVQLVIALYGGRRR